MKRVLVTGASGFIGRHTLKPLLAEGYEVFAISRSGLEGFPEVNWLRGDLFDSLWLEKLLQTVKPSHLLHCAWYTEHGKFWNAPQNLDWLAVSLRLIKAFQECGGKRVVVAGTCAEYDWVNTNLLTPLPPSPQRGEGEEEKITYPPLHDLDYHLILESDRTVPSSLYGESKLALLRVLAKFAPETGLSYGWGRVFWVFGPGEPEQKLISSLIKALRGDRLFVCNSGEARRDFIPVQDVGNALVKILSSQVEGAVNIASGQPLKIGDVVRYLAQEMHKPDLVEIHPGEQNPVSICANISTLKNIVKYTPEDIYLALKRCLIVEGGA